MKKRKIGIPGWMTGEKSFGILSTYGTFIQRYLDGEIHILTPEMAHRPDLDILLLPGGADVNPIRYGQFPEFTTGNPNGLLEHFDVMRLPEYLASNTPILGICRGMQTLAVTLGSELYQDIWHETNSSDNKGAGVHPIKDPSRPNDKMKVNSRHHQIVLLNDVSKSNGVVVEAVHSNYGSIEAISVKDRPIFAVQFHPEDLDENAPLRWLREKLKLKHII